jgi:hypothetical protein
VIASALRSIVGAGVCAAALLLGAPCFVALAQPADSVDDGGSDVGGASAPFDGDATPPAGGPPEGAAPGGGGGATVGGEHPTSTVGNGRSDVKSPSDPVVSGGGSGEIRPSRQYTPWRIPFVRIPTLQEYAQPGWTPPSAYFTTIEIPVVTLGDVLRALTKPPPKPEPTPSARFMPEAPVIDAAPGPGAGGSDYQAVADTPRAFEVPLVAAPRMPAPPRMSLQHPAGVSVVPQAPAGTSASAAGVNTPVIRGSLPPSGPPVTVARPLAARTGESTPLGYPRYLRNPTVGELSLIALPGVAGMLFMTFGGGVIGYRQANSVRFLRTGSAARFLPE